jgi:hypothetical protein
MPNKMSNPFRAISGNTTPKKSQDNPPRTIFSDYPAAHSAITSVPAAKEEKIPSPTPGMPKFDDPFARLPPTIDLPEKYTGGPAPDEIKVRVASSELTGVDVTERPLLLLLPPTVVQIQAVRHDTSRQSVVQIFREPFSEEGSSCHEVSKESYELKVSKDDARHSVSVFDGRDRVTGTQSSLETFGFEGSSRSSVNRMAGAEGIACRVLGPDVHQSNTLDSVIVKCNDNSECLRIRGRSRQSNKISTSQEASSLSADDDDDDDGDVPFYDSAAGHTPPLSNLIFARQIPKRSTSGLPPSDPLTVAPAGQAFRYAQDVSSSELTNHGNARDLLNMADAHEERDTIKEVAGVGYNRHQDPVYNPTGKSTSGRLQLMGQGFIPVYRDAPNQEREMFETSTSVGSPKVGSGYGIGVGNESAGSVETFLQPVTYMPNVDDSRLSSVGPTLPVHPAANQERDGEDEEEEEEEPMRLRRRVEIPPAPDMSRYRQLLDPGGPQSSLIQGMSADSSFRRGRPASMRLQSPEILASLTGEGPQGSQQDMQTLIEDIGAMFGVVEEDVTVFEDDVIALKPEEQGDDCDWETVYESSLKNSIPQRSMTHHDETATSLANMSSYASLTCGVPATPRVPLTGRVRVPTYPAKVAAPSRSHVRTDTKTSLSEMLLPECEALGELYGCDEHEMTESIRPPALERPFPALAATNLPSAIRQQRSYTSYRHPEPMSEEHKHPFSLTPPTMTSIEGFRANSPTNPDITSNEVQYYGPAEKDKGSGEDTTRIGLVISKKRNTQQLSASVNGYSFENNTSDLRELSRPSNASIDGSYAESVHSGPALSTSCIIHNSQYLPHTSGTFSKTTVLGPKSNITGSFGGTGMRAVGSSEAGYSTDSAIVKSHKYERLDDERTLDQADQSTDNNTTAQDTSKTPKNITFAEDSEISMGAQVPTSVLTKNGLPISCPRTFRIPTT